MYYTYTSESQKKPRNATHNINLNPNPFNNSIAITKLFGFSKISNFRYHDFLKKVISSIKIIIDINKHH